MKIEYIKRNIRAFEKTLDYHLRNAKYFRSKLNTFKEMEAEYEKKNQKEESSQEEGSQ